MTTSPLRIALLSLHTSPLRTPGQGDAGGMNTYIATLADALARAGHHVDVYTRDAGFGDSPAAALGAATCHTVPAGPPEAAKSDLPAHVVDFAKAVQAHPAASAGYDIIHSHYWLSAAAGEHMRTAWDAPHVMTMHTLACVKNERLAPGDAPEPHERVTTEKALLGAADAVIVNTPEEARNVSALYNTATERVHVVPPAIDGAAFCPPAPADAPTIAATRAAWGAGPGEVVVLFVGRIQALKGPDVLIDALSRARHEAPELAARIRLVINGGSSGDGPITREVLARRTAEYCLTDQVMFADPVPRSTLADHYRSADLVAVPSRHESFGLVACEAAACATPVIASRAGGLPHAVADGVNGVLVPAADTKAWARALLEAVRHPERFIALGERGPAHAAAFTPARLAAHTAAVYGGLTTTA